MARRTARAISRAPSVIDTHISNSDEEALLLGGSGARILRLHVAGSQQHGIRAEDSATDTHITDSVIDDAGNSAVRFSQAYVFDNFAAAPTVSLRNSGSNITLKKSSKK